MAEITQQKQSSYLLLIVLILCLVATLTTIAVLLKKSDIESDLTQRANRLLIISGLLKGKVTFEGRDAYIEGSITSEKSRQRVVEIVEGVDGVRVVTEKLTIMSLKKVQVQADSNIKTVEKPTTLKGRFTLRHDDGQWILVGRVESEVTKENLIESTQEVIGKNIKSLLSVDPSKERPNWIDKYLHILEAFSNVHGGAELTLDKGVLIVGGNVDSEAAMRMTLLPISKSFGDVVSIRNTLRILSFENGIYQPSKHHDIEKVNLSDIQFNKENTEVQSVSNLDKVLSMMEASPYLYIELAGHANHSLDEDQNIQVSLTRALLVKQYLINHGIKQSRLRSNGYGSSRPIDKEKSSHNQRIEVIVIREG